MSDRFCLVILDSGEKKKVKLQEGSYKELTAAINAFTEIPPDERLIQIYDNDVDDFTDLEKDDEIANKAKIRLGRRIIIRSNVLQDVTAAAGYTNAVVDLNSPSTSNDAEMNHFSAPSIIKENVPVADKCDYLKFRLPTFGHWETVLSRGTPISGDVRRAVVDSLYQESMKLALYPSQHLYRRAVDLLLRKYPHLRDNFALKGNESGHQSWVEGLKCKFKNMRKKLDGNPAVLAMREKHGYKRSGINVPDPGSAKRISRLCDQEHLTDYGETEESQERHTQWLMSQSQEELTVETQERMLTTAKQRHEKMMKGTLADALLEFPFLATESALLVEFKLLWKVDLADAFETGFMNLANIILKHGEAKEVVILSERSSENAVLGGIEIVAGRCNEKLENIICKDAPAVTPCLVLGDTVKVFVDKQELFTASSMLSGICAIFAAFWVFHIEYPRNFHRSLTFFEHAFAGLKHTKPRMKCVDFIKYFSTYSDIPM